GADVASSGTRTACLGMSAMGTGGRVNVVSGCGVSVTCSGCCIGGTCTIGSAATGAITGRTGSGRAISGGVGCAATCGWGSCGSCAAGGGGGAGGAGGDGLASPGAAADGVSAAPCSP